MKVNLEIDLENEPLPGEDHTIYKLFKFTEYEAAYEEFYQYMRNKLKYENHSLKVHNEVQAIFIQFIKIYNERGL